MKNNRTIIIAEAGVNHNGKLSLAKKLIVAAAKSGADYVKFQTFEPSQMIRPKTKMARYQKKNIKKNFSQYQMLKKYQLKKNYYEDLIQHSKKNNIKFISSPFDIESIKFLNKLKLDFIKIPSGEIDNYPYLKALGKLNKKIILSTGMSNLKEILAAIKILTKFGTNKKKISLLHCHSDYPSKPINLNLKSIQTLKKTFNLRVGYSDHSLGIEAAIVSVSLGAEIIEKHLTLSKKMDGPDHKASIEPKTFKDMVLAIRKTEDMLGSGLKVPTKNELINKKLVRKSLVAKVNIQKGEKFSILNLTTKRPGTGKSPMIYESILKTRSKKKYNKNDFI
jgi:N,N'-diacetyllegionaminate synthase|tara:strand:+ start:1155 stop:2159 length:1005 start_codon:yes stop_codon:yes gene_type:complete